MMKFLFLGSCCFLFLVSCQKHDDELVEKEDPKTTERVEKKITLTSNQVHRGANLRSKDLAREISLSMEAWANTDDIIDSAKRSIEEFEHPQLKEPMAANALAQALDDPRQIFEALKDDKTYWNSDHDLRNSAIALCSLLAGLIGIPDEEIVSRLPDLFLNEERETERDMLMLQAAKQVIPLAESKKRISGEAFDEWLSMARSSNEITRYTVLILLDLVALTEMQSQRFFDAYSQEKNQTIIDLVALKSKKLLPSK